MFFEIHIGFSKEVTLHLFARLPGVGHAAAVLIRLRNCFEVWVPPQGLFKNSSCFLRLGLVLLRQRKAGPTSSFLHACNIELRFSHLSIGVHLPRDSSLDLLKDLPVFLKYALQGDFPPHSDGELHFLRLSDLTVSSLTSQTCLSQPNSQTLHNEMYSPNFHFHQNLRHYLALSRLLYCCNLQLVDKVLEGEDALLDVVEEAEVEVDMVLVMLVDVELMLPFPPGGSPPSEPSTAAIICWLC